jgi:hypothetical protein
MIKIVDNFYKNPDKIRKMALESKYELISSGNYIGHDTLDKNVIFPELEQNIRSIFPDPHCKVVCSRFRSAVEGDTHLTFVHADAYERDSGWHILIYLTKGKYKDGLTFYDHVNSGPMCTEWNAEHGVDTEDFEKFIPKNTIPYKYNRAVVLDYSYFHSPMHHTGIGDSIKNSRLMHIIEVIDDRSAHYKYRLSFPGAGMARNDEPNGGNDDDGTLDGAKPGSLSRKGVEEFIN